MNVLEHLVLWLALFMLGYETKKQRIDHIVRGEVSRQLRALTRARTWKRDDE